MHTKIYWVIKRKIQVVSKYVAVTIVKGIILCWKEFFNLGFVTTEKNWCIIANNM